MKKVLLVTLITFSLVYSQSKTSKISSDAGAFSRMGFGARGMGMGNAVSSVTEGNVVSYYNPALSVFQEGNFFQASYSFLSFDRTLNFINFTRKFQFKSSDTSSRKFIPVAGLSAGIINAGVSKIDGRDNQGIKTGDLSTSENQFFLSFANRFSKKLAIGIAAKFYYYRLYDKITSGGFGLDIGLLYMLCRIFVASSLAGNTLIGRGPLFRVIYRPFFGCLFTISSWIRVYEKKPCRILLL